MHRGEILLVGLVHPSNLHHSTDINCTGEVMWPNYSCYYLYLAGQHHYYLSLWLCRPKQSSYRAPSNSQGAVQGLGSELARRAITAGTSLTVRVSLTLSGN